MLIVSLRREVEALQNENDHLRKALDINKASSAERIASESGVMHPVCINARFAFRGKTTNDFMSAAGENVDGIFFFFFLKVYANGLQNVSIVKRFYTLKNDLLLRFVALARYCYLL